MVFGVVTYSHSAVTAHNNSIGISIIYDDDALNVDTDETQCLGSSPQHLPHLVIPVRRVVSVENIFYSHEMYYILDIIPE